MQHELGQTDQELDAYRAAIRRGDHDEAERIRAAWEPLDAWVQRRVQRLIDAESDPVLQEQAARAIARARAAATQARKRSQERERARARARGRQVRIARTVQLPTQCARCSAGLPTPASTGRPKLYCSPVCRKAAYEDRRARRPSAVQVQLVEKIVTERVAHSEGDCVRTVLGHHGRIDEVIRGLETMLRTTPVPELRSRWFEVGDYMRRLSRALDQAEHRAEKYAAEHPNWES